MDGIYSFIIWIRAIGFTLNHEIVANVIEVEILLIGTCPSCFSGESYIYHYVHESVNDHTCSSLTFLFLANLHTSWPRIYVRWSTHLGLPRTCTVLALKISCPQNCLSPRQAKIVGYPTYIIEPSQDQQKNHYPSSTQLSHLQNHKLLIYDWFLSEWVWHNQLCSRS